MEINYSHGRLSPAQQSICPTVKSETREDQQISNYPPRDSTINKNVLPAINSLLNWKNSQKEGCMGGCNLACMWCQTQNSSSEPLRSVVDRADRCDNRVCSPSFFSSNWSVLHFLGCIVACSSGSLLAKHTWNIIQSPSCRAVSAGLGTAFGKSFQGPLLKSILENSVTYPDRHFKNITS